MTRGAGRRAQDKGAFGTVSKLPSGHWRAMYYGPDGTAGRRYSAPTTFKTKTDARKFLSTVQADMIRNTWLPPVEAQPEAPDAKTLTVAGYAETWWKQNLTPELACFSARRSREEGVRAPAGKCPSTR